MKKRYLLEGLERRVLLTAVSWDGGGDGVSWSTPANWSNDAVPTSADDVTIDVVGSPSIVLTGVQSIRSLTNAESLTLRANVSTGHGMVNLGAGASGNTGSITLDVTDFSGYQAIVVVSTGVTLTNSGTISATRSTGAEQLTLANSSTFINSGTISVPAGLSLPINGNNSADSVFQQQGTITVGAGGSFTVNNAMFKYLGGSNTAGVYVSNSNLDFQSAASASTVVVHGTSNTFVNNSSSNLTMKLESGASFGHAIVNVSATAANSGPIVLSAIDFSGYQAILSVASGKTFTNSGSIAVSGNNNYESITLANFSTFINSGTISVPAGLSLPINGNNPADSTFQQQGTISVGAGGSFTVNNAMFNYLGGSNTAGVYASNCSLDFQSAASASTVVVHGNSNTFVNNSSANLTMSLESGASFGHAIVNVSASAANSGQIVLNATDFSGYQAIVAVPAGVTFTNTGTISATGSNGSEQLTLANSSTFLNSGTISVPAGLSLPINGNNPADSVFQQQGAITVGAGGSFTVNNAMFKYLGGSNTAGVYASNGSLDFQSAATPSTIVVRGNTNAFVRNDSVNLTLDLEATAGSHAIMQVPANATNSGVIMLDSTGSSGYSAVITVADGFGLTNSISGTIKVMQGLGGPRSINGSVSNQGLIEFIGNVDVSGSGTVTNTGTIKRTDSATTVFAANLVNQGNGLIDIAAGTIRFTGTTNIGSGAFLTGGRYHVAGSATLGFGNFEFQRPTINTADIEVTGSGVAELNKLITNRGRIALLSGNDLSVTPMTGGVFTNEGIIDLSPDSVFSVSGNMNFAGTSQPVIRSEIASASSFGKVMVSGTFNLDSPDSTSRFDPDLVNSYDPPLNTTFDIITASPVSNGFDSFQGGLTPSSNVLLLVRPNANVVQVKIGPGPLPPAPQLLSETYEYETRQAVVFEFNQDVSAFLSRKDYQLENLTTSQTVPNSVGALSYNQPSNEAILTLTNELADGNYELTVNAADIANSAGVPASGAPIILEFYVLSADANREHSVDTIDFGILAANFGLSGKTFSEGNFDYDALGIVDTVDFGLLSANFGKALASATSRSGAAGASVSATASQTGTIWPFAGTDDAPADLFSDLVVAELL